MIDVSHEKVWAEDAKYIQELEAKVGALEARLAEAQRHLVAHPNPDLERKLFRKAYVNWLRGLDAVLGGVAQEEKKHE